jgi:hypothetical protein
MRGKLFCLAEQLRFRKTSLFAYNQRTEGFCSLIHLALQQGNTRQTPRFWFKLISHEVTRDG